MVKITDVATAARVSAATVSRTLNNNEKVDPALAARVREAAERLGYRPNAVARNLRRQGTQVWALIITDINNPFFTALARGVEDVAQESGFSVLLCNSDEDIDKEARYLGVAEQERAAGVILSPRATTSDVSRLLASNIPLVAVDRGLGVSVDTVRADSVQGAVAATEQLLRRGWQRPACITGPADAETAEERHLGYQSVVRRLGLDEIVQHVRFQAEGGQQAVQALFDAAAPPDSLFVANSMLALGALAELKRRRLRVGRDIGLVTFDDAPWASLIHPTITVVAQPAYDIGAEAARILVQRIRKEGPTEPQQVLFGTELIVRQSCRRRKPHRSADTVPSTS
ncbi:LacI family DNA-binding transcriptional regulator [Microlunatus panaciterrae]|uniref:LacI family transcriptional regulator n=1 Tax=Microlunatus panaciterrae TaxID=400768 RepID=A0ABS2RGA1_9ACTN|nr:LacI family DNA-binding transcriptional regulator [Microlunatus panaciterrae]MBM7798030.1 LacI family transcriptional regulator [Microlunatus panaciterrae]